MYYKYLYNHNNINFNFFSLLFGRKKNNFIVQINNFLNVTTFAIKKKQCHLNNVFFFSEQLLRFFFLLHIKMYNLYKYYNFYTKLYLIIIICDNMTILNNK